MTREEAIYFANCLKNNYTVDLNDMEAFCDEVIKVLEQEPILDKIRAEIEQKLGTHGNISLYNRAIYDVLMIHDKYKPESEE